MPSSERQQSTRTAVPRPLARSTLRAHRACEGPGAAVSDPAGKLQRAQRRRGNWSAATYNGATAGGVCIQLERGRGRYHGGEQLKGRHTLGRVAVRRSGGGGGGMRSADEGGKKAGAGADVNSVLRVVFRHHCPDGLQAALERYFATPPRKGDENSLTRLAHE